MTIQNLFKYIALMMCMTLLAACSSGGTGKPGNAKAGMKVVFASNGVQSVLPGTAGTVLVSTDMQTWSPVSIGTTEQLGRVLYLNNLYFAFGLDGGLYTSADGLTWQKPFSDTSRGVTSGTSTPNALVDAAYNGSLYVVVGYGGFIVTSPDAVTWTVRNAAIVGGDNDIESIAYGAGRFVAVGGVNTSLITTSTDGITWTYQGTEPNEERNAIDFGNNQFVVCSSSGNMYTSPDGLAWTLRSTGVIAKYDGVTFANGLFIVTGITDVANPTAVIMTSPDAITWIQRNSAITSQTFKNDISFDNNLFVSPVFTSISTVPTLTITGVAIQTSSDGITWTQKTVSSGTAQQPSTATALPAGVTDVMLTIIPANSASFTPNPINITSHITGGSPVSIPNLTDGATYTFRVDAFDSKGTIIYQGSSTSVMLNVTPISIICTPYTAPAASINTIKTVTSMTIDGSVADWAGIQPILSDPSNDTTTTLAGADITAVYLAKDSNNMYARIDMANGPPSSTLYYVISFDTSANKQVGDRMIFVQMSTQAVTVDTWLTGGSHSPIINGSMAVSGNTIEISVPLASLNPPATAYIGGWDDISGPNIDKTTQVILNIPASVAKVGTPFPIANGWVGGAAPENSSSIFIVATPTGTNPSVITTAQPTPQALATSGLPLDGQPQFPTSIARGSSNYLTAWTEINTATNTSYVMARLLDANGTPTGTPITVVASTPSALPRDPRVAFDGTNYFVVWSQSNGSDDDLKGRFISTAGVAGSPIDISAATGGFNENSGSLFFANGNYYVGYVAGQNAAYNIFMRSVTTAGVVSSPVQANTTKSSTWNPTYLAFDGTNLLVIMHINSGTGTNNDLYARFVSTTLVPVGSEIVVANTANTDFGGMPAFDGSKYLISWTEFGTSSATVYGKHLLPSGTFTTAQPFVISNNAAMDGCNFISASNQYLCSYMTYSAYNPDIQLLMQNLNGVMGVYVTP